VSKPLETRSEFLFLYEVRDANPNGDPLDDNKPRSDSDTNQCLVSDVRIKRTIRDYWHETLGIEVLIRDTHGDEGFLKTGEQRSGDFAEQLSDQEFESIGAYEDALRDVILSECIDARTFGCTLPVSASLKGKRGSTSGSITLTGPSQIIGFSRSLHPVTVQFIQGTAAFAGKEGASRKSFREEYKVPYACIASYGIVNEVAAKSTQMTDEDRALLLDGLWNGTAGLITRSKVGHQPLLLMHVKYSDRRHLGDLAGRIELQSDKQGQEIRSLSDYEVEFGGLLQGLVEMGDGVETVEIKSDSRLRLLRNGEPLDLMAFDELPVQSLEV
jgi:CRISPR-associated protein Csh2